MLRCGAMEWRTKNWTFCIIFYEKNQCFLFAFPSLRDFDAISILEALRILQYSNWLNFICPRPRFSHLQNEKVRAYRMGDSNQHPTFSTCVLVGLIKHSKLQIPLLQNENNNTLNEMRIKITSVKNPVFYRTLYFYFISIYFNTLISILF